MCFHDTPLFPVQGLPSGTIAWDWDDLCLKFAKPNENDDESYARRILMRGVVALKREDAEVQVQVVVEVVVEVVERERELPTLQRF